MVGGAVYICDGEGEVGQGTGKQSCESVVSDCGAGAAPKILVPGSDNATLRPNGWEEIKAMSKLRR